MNNWIKILFVVFCNSCTMTSEKYFVAPSRELQSTILMDKDSSLLIGDTDFITSINNHIYINDVYGGHCFTMYDMINHTACRFCSRGKGPGEMIRPFPAVSAISIGGDNYIHLFDLASLKILLLKADSLDYKHKFREMPFGSNAADNLTMEIFPINDSVILATGVFIPEKVCRFYVNGVAGNETYVDVLTKSGKDQLHRNLNDGNKLEVSPNKEYLVRITQFGGLIELYKIEDMQLIQQFRKEYFDVTCDRYGYIDVCINDSKIYALYDGGLIHREYPQAQSKEVHVYDFEGNAIETILLDKFVSGITVNNQGTQLYALSKDEKDLLLFNL